VESHLVRWGGLASSVAGVVFVVAGLLILIAPPQGAVLDSFGDYFVKVIFVVALALTLGAIVGLHALQSGRYGPLGTASSSITFLGYTLIVIETIVTVLTGSDLSTLSGS
jgi:hypothetical protein